MIFDFTFTKYDKLCEEISKSQYKVYTMKEYLLSEKDVKKYIILRHDVDRNPESAILMARIENKYNIKSTYYFRYIERVFKPNLIKSVHDLGHEIGYHYEVLDKANGNPDLAIKIFEQELSTFRKYFNIKTIAQHGSPLAGDLDVSSLKGITNIIKNIVAKKNIFTKRKNFNVWDKCDFSLFGISGEAYLSINFDNLVYMSDSGGSWKDKYKIKDKPVNKFNISQKLRIDATDDIIDIIRNGSIERMYLLVHPNHWANNYFQWLTNKTIKSVRNTIKVIFKKYSII